MPFIFPWSHPLYAISAFLLGACVGSFLNVVIYRLPRGLSVNEPKRSFCPKCKYQIPMSQNIPLVTWLIQRGKCASCKGSIPVRYFLVELLTALVWVGCWYWFDHPGVAFFWMVISSILIVITAVDAELMVIPRELTITGTVIALLGAALMPTELMGEAIWWRGLLKAGFGLALGWCGLWAIVLLGKVMFGSRKFEFTEEVEWMLKEPVEDDEELCYVINGESIGWSDIFFRKTDKLVMNEVGVIRVDGVERKVQEVVIHDNHVIVDGERLDIENLKSLDGTVKKAVIPREAMGMGDVDLLGMLGACMGAVALLPVIFIACIFSLLLALVAQVGLGKHMPFGPSIIFGAVVWVLCGPQLVDLYLKMMGL
ncbi:prepilin peptidase [Rubritalea halochordaticola]